MNFLPISWAVMMVLAAEADRLVIIENLVTN